MSTDDDKLLEDLGRAVRGQERNEEAQQLVQLSRGELAGDALAKLRARAAADPQLSRALAAHAPVNSDVKAQIGARLVALAQARAAASQETPAAPTSARVIALEPRTRVRRALWVALPLSAAAAALLWLSGSKQVAPIPLYDLQISGTQAEMRSVPSAIDVHDANAVLRVGKAEQVHVLLRPATEVAGEIVARAFVAHGDAIVAWPAQTERAESGALQLVLSAPPAPVAGAEAWIVVGRPELVETRAEALVRGADAQGPGFQRWHVRLEPGRD